VHRKPERTGKWKESRSFSPQANREKTLPQCADPPAPRKQTVSLHKCMIMIGIRAGAEGVSGGAQVRASRYFDSVLARGMLFAVTGCWGTKRGGTGVLFWKGVLWYRSAIAVGGSRSQPWDCVGKVCASHLYSVVLSLRHPADAKQHDEAHRPEVVQGQH
jgi:hypothetical protein